MVLIFAVVSAYGQRTPVKTGDLPKAISENITKDYAGFTIKEATRVVSNNIVNYEVVINKGNKTETLLYDKDGKFLKKVGSKEEPQVKKNNTPQPQKKSPAPSTTTK